MKIMLVSVPKSGTNMLDQMVGTVQHHAYVIRGDFATLDKPVPRILEEIRNPPEQFVRTHLIYLPEYAEAMKSYERTFFLYRDFRDCIVSSVYWDSRGGTYTELKDVRLSKKQINERIFIQLEKWRFVYPEFVGWLKQDWIKKFKYEDFILHKKETLDRLAKEIGGNFASLERVMGKQEGPTFRKGIIGDWKSHFTEQHSEKFWEYFGEVMKEFGYENNS